ncbi:SH3 domain-containing protein [Streptomyces roseus]|uniref:SH3 domain-containing protein n=1 Tax=Streptomyces roseus TaxID=66430 RepID=UPI00069D5AE7|nr:SH3 domain-containing protein [Streptomyces roseus]
MRKPTRTVLALAAASLVLGGAGAGTAVADDGPTADGRSQQLVVLEPDGNQAGSYRGREYSVGKVVSRGPLKLRSKPTSRSESVGHVKPGHKVAIECKVRGEKVDGNDLWYLLHVKERDGQAPVDRPGDSDTEDGTDAEDGSDAEDGAQAADRMNKGRKDREDRNEAWVTARYVKNLDRVKWCD